MHQCSCTNKIIIAIFAGLIIAIVPAAMAANETPDQQPVGGTIIVISWPAGAAVYLNGEYLNNTPARFEKVPPGEYLITVSLAGFRNETIPTEIYNGSTREIGVNLEKASSSPSLPAGDGMIAVDSTPGGASVTLDGKPVGKTPSGRAALILNAVPSGSHTVTVELAGYSLYTSTVTVIRNQVVKVNADFTPGNPTISGTPNIPGTPIATTDRTKAVPLSPLTAIAAAGLIGLAAMFRRS